MLATDGRGNHRRGKAHGSTNGKGMGLKEEAMSRQGFDIYCVLLVFTSVGLLFVTNTLSDQGCNQGFCEVAFRFRVECNVTFSPCSLQTQAYLAMRNFRLRIDCNLPRSFDRRSPSLTTKGKYSRSILTDFCGIRASAVLATQNSRVLPNNASKTALLCFLAWTFIFVASTLDVSW